LSVAGRTPGRQAQQASIRVGPGCAWYWLNLIVGSPAEGSRFEATVDRPRIDRLPG
jgi:hypothetical protein